MNRPRRNKTGETPRLAGVTLLPDAGVQRPVRGAVVWFTGLSGAGKTTLANGVARRLRLAGVPVEVLDGDEVRPHLSHGLGFSKADRDTNVIRVGYVASLLAKHGVVVLVSLVSPYRAARGTARRAAGNVGAHFAEVFVDAPVELCTRRDVKGLYQRAMAGKIPNFTGISDPYEPPHASELIIPTGDEPIDSSVARVVTYLERVVQVTVGSDADAEVRERNRTTRSRGHPQEQHVPRGGSARA